jgi:hypothetical protein
MDAEPRSRISEMPRDIPRTPPRPISLLPGLSYRAMADKSVAFPVSLFALFFLIVPLMTFLVDKRARLAFIDMKQADAEIIDLIGPSECDRNRKELHYAFRTAGGRSYYGEASVCKGSVYFNIQKGDSIPIIFDPHEPSFNGIEGILGRDEPPLLIFIVFPVFFLLILVPFFWPSIRQHHKSRNIFGKGIITEGAIVFVKRKGGSSFFHFAPFTKFQIFYKYRLENGSLIESNMLSDNDWIVNRLDVGSAVHVAYIETKPRDSVILDFYLR